MSLLDTLSPGLVVETFDHRVVGRIAAVRAERMLLRASCRRPFWLSTALVRSVDDGRVRLHIDRRVIGRYRVPSLERASLAWSGLKPPMAMIGGFLTTAAAAALWLAS